MRQLFFAGIIAGFLGFGSFAYAQTNQYQPQGNQQFNQQQQYKQPTEQKKHEGDFRKEEFQRRDDMQTQKQPSRKEPIKDIRQQEKQQMNGKKQIDDRGNTKEQSVRTMKGGEQNGCAEGTDCGGQNGCAEGTVCEGQQQFGPSDEQMAEQEKRMEEEEKRREEQEKKMDEQRFKQMKRGMSQFGKGVKQMKKEMARMEKKLAKCGAGIPEELKNAISASEAALPKIEAAKTADELEEIVGDVEDNGELMREWGPKMGDLQRSCDMLKRAGQDLKKMKKEVGRLENRVKAQKKLDLSELLQELKVQIDVLATALQKAKDLAKTDPEGALDTLDDEFFEGSSDFYLTREALDMALNITKGLKQSDSELKRYTRMITKLEKKKKDVSEAKDILSQLKVNQSEITKLVKQKFDPEDLVSLIEETFTMRDDLVNLLEDFGVLKDYMPQFKSGPGVKFNLPPGFERKQEPQEPPLEEENGIE